MGASPSFLAVPRQLDQHVIETLRELLAKAESGQIIGLAYVAMQPAYEYQGDLVGYALEHPVMALGLLKALEDQVVKIIR